MTLSSSYLLIIWKIWFLVSQFNEFCLCEYILKEWCMQFLSFSSLLALLSQSPLNLCKNCSHKLNVAHMSFFRIVLCSGKLYVLSFYIFMLLKRLFMWMWKYQHAQNLCYICSTPLLLLKNMEVTSKTDTLTAIIPGMHPIF